MSGVQFAKRQKVSPARVASLEKAEITGAVTIRSMRKAAAALDCVFVYALVPRSSLENTLREQARRVAQARLEHTSHTMLLEDQRLSSEDLRRVLDGAVAELMDAMPRDLWDGP
jgi:predicted DNA-binding mobile mystery protein A